MVRHVSLHWLFGIAGSANRSAIVCRNLQMNFPDLTASKCTMRFKDTQKVSGLRRTMLLNVAHRRSRSNTSRFPSLLHYETPKSEGPPQWRSKTIFSPLSDPQ